MQGAHCPSVWLYREAGCHRSSRSHRRKWYLLYHCSPFVTRRQRTSNPDRVTQSRATADILIAYERALYRYRHKRISLAVEWELNSMELRLELRVSSTQGRVFERDGAEHGAFCPTAAALVPRKRACPPVKGRWGISSVEDESARRGVGFWSRSRSARSATAHSDVLAERRLGSELKDLVR